MPHMRSCFAPVSIQFSTALAYCFAASTIIVEAASCRATFWIVFTQLVMSAQVEIRLYFLKIERVQVVPCHTSSSSMHHAQPRFSCLLYYRSMTLFCHCKQKKVIRTSSSRPSSSLAVQMTLYLKQDYRTWQHIDLAYA